MKEHLRVDTFKVFDEDNKNLDFIMTKNKLNKSEAYRLALQTYVNLNSVIEENKKTSKEVESLSKEVKDLKETINELYQIILHKVGDN